MEGTKNKNNSYRNKNNTFHYGPGWGSLLPLQFRGAKIALGQSSFGPPDCQRGGNFITSKYLGIRENYVFIRTIKIIALKK